jgi:hypothetical protein
MIFFGRSRFYLVFLQATIKLLLMKHILLFVCLLTGVTLQAQTDYTSYIQNPSFENGLEGWTYKNMSVQANSVFSLKAGTNYVEKWTGKGGAVGSAIVSQQLKQLPPGNYELSVAAQNIQEDSPSAAQTGAWIFAETRLWRTCR